MRTAYIAVYRQSVISACARLRITYNRAMRPRIYPAIPEVAKVVQAFGGATKLARVCGVEPQSVSGWMRKGIPQAREQYLRLLNPAAFKRPH
jgi:hypothetical protein